MSVSVRSSPTTQRWEPRTRSNCRPSDIGMRTKVSSYALTWVAKVPRTCPSTAFIPPPGRLTRKLTRSPRCTPRAAASPFPSKTPEASAGSRPSPTMGRIGLISLSASGSTAKPEKATVMSPRLTSPLNTRRWSIALTAGASRTVSSSAASDGRRYRLGSAKPASPKPGREIR